MAPHKFRTNWHFGVILLPFLLLLSLLTCSLRPSSTALAEPTNATTTSSDSNQLEYATINELAGKQIGMLNGGVFDELLLKNWQGFSSSDFSFFNSNAEAVGALQTSKIEAMVTDLPIAQLVVNNNAGLAIMPEKVMNDKYGYVLPKGSPLTSRINERIAAYNQDGTINELAKKWTGSNNSAKTMPEQNWDTPNGTITVATTVDNEPVNYSVNNQPCGMSIELLEMVARDLGYGIEYRTTNAASLIAEVQSGKADIAAFSFSITEERKQMVDMSEPFYEGGVTVVVRSTTFTKDSNENFFIGLANSFKRTFVDENRWQIVLEGLGVTLLISVSSGVLGLGLGFAFVLVRRKREGGLADRLVKMLENLLGGLPIVVVLMLFYYVVFGSVSISGIVVAIMVFTLLFGATSGSIMWNAIRAINPGQAEAGRALGFGDHDTFFLVVLPQAARQFAPLLLAQFVTLVKDTSIVGYIAVQDLTRVGDLIRARTMEAFFPLIAIAGIYFVICRLLSWLLSLFTKKLEPNDGPRTIKGVDLH